MKSFICRNMTTNRTVATFGLLALLVGVALGDLQYADEPYFKNVRQLTFNGHHSLADFNHDGSKLLFSARGGDYGMECDQIYQLNLNDLTEKPRRLSTGLGAATEARYWPGRDDVTFQSNFHNAPMPSNFTASATCPARVCRQPNLSPAIKAVCKKPHLELLKNSDIFAFNKYANIDRQLTFNESPYVDSAWVMRDFQGSMFYYFKQDDMGVNLYVRPWNNENETVLVTHHNITFFGGLSIDRDERRLAFHGYIPTTGPAAKELLDSLDAGLVPIGSTEIYYTTFEGLELQVVSEASGNTNLYPAYASYAGNKIVFTSNLNRTDGGSSLYLFNIFDETLLPVSTSTKGVTTTHAAISADFTKIVFASNRNSTKASDFQLFIADFNITGTSSPDFDGDGPPNPNMLVSKVKETSTSAAAKCWQDTPVQSQFDGIVHFKGEDHLTNVRQITFGGENAEGYFSFDDNLLTLQATGSNYYGTGCDQIYQLDLCKDPTTTDPRKMSTGVGATTCSFIYPDNRQSLYAGTFRSTKINQSAIHDASCPTKLCDHTGTLYLNNATVKEVCDHAAYTWDIYPEYDIYLVNEYGIITQQLTDSPGYDAEGVISPDGKLIAFTSTRNGDLDLYVMNIDGSNLVQVTKTLGYDGGAFFSPDSKRLIFRASRPTTPEEIAAYKLYLSFNIVVPLQMELFVVDIDGKNMKQITKLGGASWAPYYLNDNKRVIFSTNAHAGPGAGFDAFQLFVVNDDGTGLEQVTTAPNTFNAFAMFSHKGNKLVWGSSRNASNYDINLFLADWVDPDTKTKGAAAISIIGALIMAVFGRFVL
uniref:T9SS type A sorting domain-containing protein n=1 Tax=Panagrellus redivivus TaxID=6233 RepID=A0A7E4VIH2_PANRE